MVEIEYKCIKCNKYYKSNKTLWVHNKKFHNDEENKLKCNYCNKKFSFIQSKYIHIKKCKIKHEEKIEENKLEEQIFQMKKEINELKQKNINITPFSLKNGTLNPKIFYLYNHLLV